MRRQSLVNFSSIKFNQNRVIRFPDILRIRDSWSDFSRLTSWITHLEMANDVAVKISLKSIICFNAILV